MTGRQAGPDVTAAVDFIKVEGDTRTVVPARMLYSTGDPYAVTVRFPGDGVALDWLMARSLLQLGTLGACGEGDVRVWSGWRDGARVVHVSLTAPGGQAVLEASADQVIRFLAATFRLVPAGAESPRMQPALDLAVARILEAA